MSILLCNCGSTLNIDVRFSIDAKRQNIAKQMLRCLNGHSLVVDLDKEPAEEIDFNNGDNQPRIIARNRSVLCDVCRRRIYNAHANQKRHRGYCAQQHEIKKYREEKRLHNLISPEGKKALKDKKRVKKD